MSRARDRVRIVPRRLQRALRRWRKGPLRMIYHPSYRLPVVTGPMDPRRADDVLTWALDLGLVDKREVVSPMEVSWDDAAFVHTDAYLASLDDVSALSNILGGVDEAKVSVDALLETWRRATGGTIAAAEWAVRTGGVAVNLLGGFHHAFPDKGGGFCALNDVAIAIARLRRDGFGEPIVIVDCDAHPPDGIVASIDDPLLTIWSLSTASAWTMPTARRTRVVDVRIPPGTSDAAYLDALEGLRIGRTGLAFYLAGADPLAGDPLGGLDVSLRGLRARDEAVFATLRASMGADASIVVLPAGGYLAAAWQVLAGTVAAAQGSSLAVVPGYDPMRRRTRDIMRTIDPTRDSDSSVFITEQELYGGLGASPVRREPRFLGVYTRHGLEHALTAYGFLTTLRRLGFVGLSVEIEPGMAGGPDRMKVTAEVAGHRETLMDLSASLRVLEPGFRTLFIEWLELKDPRTTFGLHRPALPGQRAPGLGMAEETMQLLMRAAERLGLDGVSMVPSHYHVAWMARSAFTPLDPEARGRVTALYQALSDVPMAEATRQLAGPGLPTEDGQTVRWEPVETVAPVSAALHEHLSNTAQAARRAESAFLDQLA